ncbi:MAG: hypothetical protein LBB64_03275 [Dysgonamonadaceae bacterium]|jgi:hypothetical protein|nr:hypothetical protein [Dysgonamonadaceae bacterium]
MKYLISFCVLLCGWTLQAQSIEGARKLYSEGKYKEATPLYEAIVQSAAKKTAALKPEAYRALGHIYYLSYEFEKSAEAYRQVATADVAPLIERSERAARMLSRCEDIQLIDSVITDKQSFLNAYLLSGESGRMVGVGDRTIYENPLGDKRYFAEKKGSYGKRLYSELKLHAEWADRREIEVPTDSLEDNDYPFALPDGLTVYYASNNKSSIGGYDLFITRYNLNNNTWLAPNQMGMPFNSIANDYLLAIDEENRIGYFATDRFQPEGKVIIYTFIPNEEVTPLENADKRTLIRRAKITSIRDSWKPRADYRAYLDKIRQSIRNEQIQAVQDFVFVVDDGNIYYTLADFQTDAAKQAFLQWQEIKTSIGQLENELDALRLEYSKAGAREKQTLSTGILSKENRLENLYTQVGLFEKKVRNIEIKSKKE